jgi:monofunctional biosynthetic peptidoglycan transglycosylase
LILFGVLLVAALAAYVLLGLPARGDVSALVRANPTTTGVMRQREAEARKAGRTPRREQAWMPISRMSRHLVHAVLASEDQKFFGHEGVDWDAIEKAVDEDRKRGRLARGGSTITQQLAKNLYFTTHKSLVRKLRELIVARWLEDDLTKRRILELYLNVIEWGDGVYGAEAAARRYYGKPASALDADEAAGLAAMIPNPRRINPRVDPRRFARAQRRVIWLMAHAGYLSRSGLGAEPPPEPVEEEEEPAPPEPEGTPASPPRDVTPSAPVSPPSEPPPSQPPPVPPAPAEAPSPEATPSPV